MSLEENGRQVENEKRVRGVLVSDKKRWKEWNTYLQWERREIKQKEKELSNFKAKHGR
jgi:hypothetical protein